LNKRGLPLSELGKKQKRGRTKRDKFIPKKCPDGRVECAWKICKFYFVSIGGKGRSTPVCGKMHPEKMRMHMLKITQRKYHKKAGTYHVQR
jgi:hypothetical protein